jgi:RNA polymerase sigma-70 factor (ECF subfamily)
MAEPPGQGASHPGADPALVTSYHVRRARGGDRESLDWLIERFSPLLRAAAEYRLTKSLRRLYDPEDIVNDVWATALPRLPELSPRDERYTPVLMKFLSTTLLYKVRNLVEKHIRGKPPREEARGPRGEDASGDPLDRLAAGGTGVASRLGREETRDLVAASLAKLDPRDREIIVLRGIEQHPYREIAAIVGDDPAVLAVRYQRALEKLRRALPGSVYEEFEEE